jgi:NAD(P)H-flavin reductase
MQKNDHVHMLYPLLYEAKKGKIYVVYGAKRKKKLCLDGPAK